MQKKGAKYKIIHKLSRWDIHLICILITLLGVGCSGSRKLEYQVRDHNKGSQVTVTLPTNISGTRRDIIKESLRWEGTPYKYGGAECQVGTDCSGMVLQVYAQLGFTLPRNSAKQAEYCEKIDKRSVTPGDLVFFATGRDSLRISHVGIILDDDRFIHASTSKGVVISRLSTPYYIRTLRMYGKVPGLK